MIRAYKNGFDNVFPVQSLQFRFGGGRHFCFGRRKDDNGLVDALGLYVVKDGGITTQTVPNPDPSSLNLPVPGFDFFPLNNQPADTVEGAVADYIDTVNAGLRVLFAAYGPDDGNPAPPPASTNADRFMALFRALSVTETPDGPQIIRG